MNEIAIDEIAKLAKKKIEAEQSKETLLVTRNQINAMCGFKQNSATLRRWEKDPTFPKPVPHSGVTRWFKTDIVAWLRGDFVSA